MWGFLVRGEVIEAFLCISIQCNAMIKHMRVSQLTSDTGTRGPRQLALRSWYIPAGEWALLSDSPQENVIPSFGCQCWPVHKQSLYT